MTVIHGKRVLGEKEWQRQSAADALRKAQGVTLGPRVTGAKKKKVEAPVEPESAAAAEVEAAELEDVALAEATDDTGADGATEPVDEPEDGNDEEGAEDGDEEGADEGTGAVTLSVKQIEHALRENQSEALFDQLFEAELARPEGRPRRGALQLFIQAEKRRETPRPAVLKELSGLVRNA